ncbi:MAG: class C sortase [Oscillospiraceae bacterium]|nr:class C sortase [Oscillospiraceae bacterium]
MVISLWKKIVFAIATVMLITGLVFLLFPPISNWIGQNIANSETEKFDNSVANAKNGSYVDALKNKDIDKDGYSINENGERTSDFPVLFKDDLDRLYKDSVAYNKSIINNQGTVTTSDYSTPALNMSSYGVPSGLYGYLSAPTIGMKLPIYLGANASSMSYGAAHLTNTSLPIGGESTNCAIAGHTGYIGRIFFDNLRGLAIGDKVILTNYWGSLNYCVTKTKVVKKNQTEDIYIEEEKDLLTLVTCISNNSGGFDRFIVICERV